MDNRPIGVFDSGLGGLTALRELTSVMPGQSIIFFGDTGRLPYGGRSKDTIIKYAQQDINFIRSFDIKLIVAACGTVSTTAIESIAPTCDVPLIGVVEPTVAAACRATVNGRIGVIGTAATIRSGAYERSIRKKLPTAKIYSNPCPLFVPLVENGRYRPDDVVVREIVKEYMTPLAEREVDTVILGCTHYPLLSTAIGQFMGKNVRLIDSGGATADYVAALLKERDMECGSDSEGGCRFFVSDSVTDFAANASLFLGKSIDGTVEGVDVTKY